MRCPPDDVLIDHLDEALTANESQRVDSHLRECSRCRATHRHLQELAKQIGSTSWTHRDDRFTAEVISRLSRPSDARTTVWRLQLAAVACLVAVVAGTLYLATSGDGQRSGEAERPEQHAVFTPRGATTSDQLQKLRKQLGFEAYGHSRSGQSRLLTPHRHVPPDTGFTFRIFNRTNSELYLMLFALDAKSEVHWFYPAYETPASNPTSIRLDQSRQVVDLPEGVTPDAPAHGPFRLVALFSSRPLQVRQIESVLASGAPRNIPQLWPDCVAKVLPIHIDRR